MLYHLLSPLRHEFSAFNVVRYITFRTAIASLTALFREGGRERRGGGERR